MSQGGVEIFQSEDGNIQLNVTLDKETVWLNQAQMVVLFGRDQSVISRHIRNAQQEGEIADKSNMQKMHIANADRPVVFYDLDVVISVGYRIKSERGVQFRRWATRVLHQHLVDGYTLNERRLNESLLKKSVDALVNDNTLVALALLVAESKPEQKDLMVRLVEHFISPLRGINS